MGCGAVSDVKHIFNYPRADIGDGDEKNDFDKALETEHHFGHGQKFSESFRKKHQLVV